MNTPAATTQPDPDLWPLAPGNATPEQEAVLQAIVARAPEPTAEMRRKVAAILRRGSTAQKVGA